ncbi:serine/threonine protein kinase [Myxococcaceae bacterium GXIMD 01537]
MPPSDGREFGKYKLLDRLATGGMAELYRARMTAAAGVTKPVVIKKILPHYAGNRAFVSMFINEATIAVGLSHGNIVQVFDFGEVDGEYFLAMEWVHGHSLSRVLRRARERGLPALPPPLALLVATELLEGLAYAHTRLDEAGRPLTIVHRDVSPQNVLLGYEGQVKLTDFGIARARLAGGPPEGGAPQGKYMYFAPEQARGHEPDARSDLFAAGTVLYEMLCGRLPFDGDMTQALRRIALGDFPRPRAVHPELPPALERIVLTAMAPEPAQRYPSAQAFHDALATYLSTEEPGLSSSALAHFMGYLFEPELVAEGRPVQLPPDFLARLARWGAAPPTAPAHRETGAPEPLERITQPVPAPAERPVPAPPLPPPPVRGSGPERLEKTAPLGMRRLRLRRRLLTVAPAVVAALVGMLLATVESTGHFTVELTSQPPGARVRVDGREWYANTPTLIPHLDAEHEHLLEVLAPGMQPWSHRVRAERGTTLAVRARLEAPPAPPSPTAPPVPNEGRYPLSGFALSPARHALHVPPSPAARVGLDPRKTYVLSTARGAAPTRAPGPQVIFLLEGGARLSAREAFGVLGPHPRPVSHASALYLFVPGAPADEPDAVEVHVREEQSGATTTVRVDTQGNAVAVPPESRFTLRGLDPATTYELLVREAEEPARTRGARGGKVGHVLSLRGGGSGKRAQDERRGTAHMLEVGLPYRVTGAAWMQFTFPDDDPADNAGGLTVEVSPVRPPPPVPGPRVPG